MKKCLLLFPVLLLLQLPARAQAPLVLELSHQKTTSLLFPFSIKSVDRGSPDVLAQVPDAVENILQVKAARAAIPETNLTVITADGSLYSFDVRYAAAPPVTQLRLEAPTAHAHPARFRHTPFHEAQLRSITGQLVSDERFYYGIRAKDGQAKARLEGVYLHGNLLFLRVVLSNQAAIPYELDFIRFSVRDRKTTRRTARQETEITPVYVHGQEDQVLGTGYQQVLVFALDKFTLARDKVLFLELFERQGSRHLQLRIKGRHLLQAAALTLLP